MKGRRSSSTYQTWNWRTNNGKWELYAPLYHAVRKDGRERFWNRQYPQCQGGCPACFFQCGEVKRRIAKYGESPGMEPLRQESKNPGHERLRPGAESRVWGFNGAYPGGEHHKRYHNPGQCGPADGNRGHGRQGGIEGYEYNRFPQWFRKLPGCL